MKKYKDTHQHQQQLLPPNLDELIDENHLVRVVDEFVSRLSPTVWDKAFKGGGAPSYHPQMMLKIILFAYSSRIFSSRQIAKAVRQDVTFMWVAGMQRPSFNTINRFRSDYFRDILEDVFTELLNFLHEKGYVNFKDYFIDGTKLEADAGRYTYVWGKNTKRFKAAVQERIRKLFEEIEALNTDEDEKYGENDLPERGTDTEISSEEIYRAAVALNEQVEDIKEKKLKRALRSRAKKLKKEADKQKKYEEQQENLAGRNSYSKTDIGGTFMRLKDGRLRAAYNLQVSTENQFIMNYSISQSASDPVSFPDHLEKIEQRGQKYIPNNYNGDSAYGSEENYSLLREKEINNYLKYNTFHTEEKKKEKDKFHHDNFIYNKKSDTYQCPEEKILRYQETITRKTKTGYVSFIDVYACSDCGNCPKKNECLQGKSCRRIHRNPLLEFYRQQARDNLNSQKGIELRKRRGPETETYFGDLKGNSGFKRFLLRGEEKVEHEAGLQAIGYNLRKIAIKRASKAVLKAKYILCQKNILIYLLKTTFFENFRYCMEFST